MDWNSKQNVELVQTLTAKKVDIFAFWYLHFLREKLIIASSFQLNSGSNWTYQVQAAVTAVIYPRRHLTHYFLSTLLCFFFWRKFLTNKTRNLLSPALKEVNLKYIYCDKMRIIQSNESRKNNKNFGFFVASNFFGVRYVRAKRCYTNRIKFSRENIFFFVK